ncbi:hypothetical protein, partial [Acetobacter pasteurianus]|uniref:hypothetical protein n=1 Tax=Acetobacter pasteurianus TaxID=438 RepID=UPI001BE04A2C
HHPQSTPKKWNHTEQLRAKGFFEPSMYILSMFCIFLLSVLVVMKKIYAILCQVIVRRLLNFVKKLLGIREKICSA